MTKTINKFTLFSTIIFLAACSTTTQMTSGDEYLAKYESVGTSSMSGDASFEETLRKVAAVEPVLEFPARLGLARIKQGRLSAIPAEELKAWMKMRDNLGKDFGEFVLVNPMIAEMVSNNVKTKDQTISTMNQVRLAGARQHMDAVLIYEIQTKSSGKDNFLEVGNLTIIGSYILPSETVEAEGYASAVLIDVMQGYPYGTADISVEKEKGYATNSESGKRGQEMENEIMTAAAVKLVPEVESLFLELRKQLELTKEQKTGKK